MILFDSNLFTQLNPNSSLSTFTLLCGTEDITFLLICFAAQ
jgi:hypothetical protein